MLLVPQLLAAQGRGRGGGANGPATLLVPARVWDGTATKPHDGWAVLVRGSQIAAVGPRATIDAPADATTIDLPGTT